MKNLALDTTTEEHQTPWTNEQFENELRKIGKKGILINDFSEIKDHDKIILPGVGNFENIMNFNIKAS